jgi:hypothetical protein
VKTNSYKSCGRKFHYKFPDKNMSIWRYYFQISEESMNPRHLTDRKLLKINRVLTEEKLDDFGH